MNDDVDDPDNVYVDDADNDDVDDADNNDVNGGRGEDGRRGPAQAFQNSTADKLPLCDSYGLNY